MSEREELSLCLSKDAEEAMEFRYRVVRNRIMDMLALLIMLATMWAIVLTLAGLLFLLMRLVGRN